jgi:hypothetical protein
MKKCSDRRNASISWTMYTMKEKSNSSFKYILVSMEMMDADFLYQKIQVLTPFKLND